MKKKSILVVWSNYYKDLADSQLLSCIELLDKSDVDYQVETVNAGCYEIPAVINYYEKHKPFDAYIALGLLLKGTTDHYEFIWEHLKSCFIQLSMNGVFIGNGVISAPDMAAMTARVDNRERTTEACRAVDYLLDLETRIPR